MDTLFVADEKHCDAVFSFHPFTMTPVAHFGITPEKYAHSPLVKSTKFIIKDLLSILGDTDQPLPPIGASAFDIAPAFTR